MHDNCCMCLCTTPVLVTASGHTELLHTQIGLAAPAIQAEIPPPVRLWPSSPTNLRMYSSHVQRITVLLPHN